ncbi:BadF/BadG/BcrA/BcrD ATPase family protein [Massilia sp. CF038]|uniref:BadF/BadG/BcrA/BcrD ATPase family protein n=1 Tax=Massilia sp. CF038 TaxID=1881045 RepID=UPI0009160857|nr:BadF/BadG/BcrA/BcrD ATPase family protein [Massilia sp. CF038]SHH16838.1 glucosamine kinase [Massilia sp. CF038]
MIEYLIGVDGGGTGTRVRLALPDGTEIAQGQSGPSGLAHGIESAWHSIRDAIAKAYASIGVKQPALTRSAIGLGLAGVHNKLWAAQFAQADPGFAALRLENDGYTTLLGAHQGNPGTIVAIGTGSVGQALLPDGSLREVGGWGFPAGDEASGGWIGLRAINHIEQVLDGRRAPSAFASAVIATCGGGRDAIQVWLGQATQTSYAQLAPIVIEHADSDDTARAFLAAAGAEVASIAHALDPSGTLPLALCGGLGAPLRVYLPPQLLVRSVTPYGDAASGALRMIAQHIKGE